MDAHDADLPRAMESLAALLEEGGETLEPTSRNTLNSLYEEVGSALGERPVARGAKLLEDWARMIALESAPTPLQRAVQTLGHRTPSFLVFDEDARALASSYQISRLINEVPPALRNLLEVAKLDFPSLLTAVAEGRTATVTTLERRASRTLASKFKAAWKQSGIEVAIRIQADVLEVQIVEADFQHTTLAERSDGLRQFVALQMFATRAHANSPVLLIDEADQRLHYDAQADLVQMLARQQVAPKVIYTTHSAGCLPEDLGNGVRTVVPDDADGTSTVVNRFWSHPEPGLAPILIGLGASTMAFFPTRRAVLVEGESDMLLYPSLFREALGVQSLGFQFVPGVSRQADPRSVVAGRGIVYLVDGDDGGLQNRDKLIKAGVAEDDVFVLGSKDINAVEVEDFVRERLLLEAANSILAKHYPEAAPIAELPPAPTRTSALEAAYVDRVRYREAKPKLPKVDLAYELLDLLNAEPSTQLLDPQRSSIFCAMVRPLVRRLQEVPRGDSRNPAN